MWRKDNAEAYIIKDGGMDEYKQTVKNMVN